MSEHRWTVPSVEEYVWAFEIIEEKLSNFDRKMLKLHYFCPERTLSATDMASAMGYANYKAANLRYGRIGGLLCERFGQSPKEKVAALCSFIPPNTQGNQYWLWVMRPPVAQALEQLEWV